MSSLNSVQFECVINPTLFLKHLSQECLQALRRNPEKLLMDRESTLCYEFIHHFALSYRELTSDGSRQRQLHN